jgi:EAL domain-containing protein (putative c-di-GMP-specific phosphodiesterase class I)
MRELGCGVAQGYLLGRSVPAGALLSIPRPALTGV